MGQKESSGPELSNREFKFLNRFAEPGSRLYQQQTGTIDRLRKKYPTGSPAQQALDVFDPKTGTAERNTAAMNLALELYQAGRKDEADAVMALLKHEE